VKVFLFTSVSTRENSMRGVSALAPKADIPCSIIASLGGFNGLGGVPFCATGYYSGVRE
jgi:hypothetical protein